MAPQHPAPSPARARFEARLAALVAALEARTEVVGVVGFGSTADRDRVDEWSDHDLAVLTEPGAEDRYRQALDWLPDPDAVALSVVDRHDGVTLVFDDGGVMEFGVATPDAFAGWAGRDAEVLLDRAGVAAIVARMVARPTPGESVDVGAETRVALAKLLIGVGRARRGELLTASRNIRGEAVEHLLAAFAAALPGDRAALDGLDPHRRFERVHPELGARVEAALRLDPEAAARELLTLAEEHLGERDDFPARGAAAIRRRLGWEGART